MTLCYHNLCTDNEVFRWHNSIPCSPLQDSCLLDGDLETIHLQCHLDGKTARENGCYPSVGWMVNSRDWRYLQGESRRNVVWHSNTILSPGDNGQRPSGTRPAWASTLVTHNIRKSPLCADIIRQGGSHRVEGNMQDVALKMAKFLWQKELYFSLFCIPQRF